MIHAKNRIKARFLLSKNDLKFKYLDDKYNDGYNNGIDAAFKLAEMIVENILDEELKINNDPN